MLRYAKNGIFSSEDMSKLDKKKVCIIGSGGLGGYILEMLTRVGVGSITIIDGDVFDETNLNRQILATSESINRGKVEVAIERMKQVNPEVQINGIRIFLNEGNVNGLIEGHDIVVDGLDSIDTRFILEKACESMKIPLVHGAIAGWYGQVTTIMPGDRTLAAIYKTRVSKGVEKNIGNPSFTPACIASFQVSEVLKVLLGLGETLSKKLLMIDLLDNEIFVLNINK
ncbi:HesA/MoeB/ThiF family protein [Serpentinicella alkaliphila]|uniref:Molybdopterin/thiamine biosynthesis adenylyltransferase n=1 Tax=Serpentinicella alkaliphila TaxID=1734049 RepID=A0A4R2TVQ7_9FIRM|nr:HesA/MoeB/ThiF family protein [Serpentinicella alkaliphila]QUH26851.1 HesA/MoeB/ThiF family protein [Serpentinicella alkaliphila]TCQ08080.1 molybdopterin/thiamine biosynthesis adenylyltransferase [Serpentinicella alkaliphila]